MKILIVEDEAPIRLLLSKTVSSIGHEVEVAEDGEAGLAAFKKFEPDIVLSDILMPKMNGLELLEKIRKISSDAVVIMVTAFGSVDYTLEALRLKANDYILKPFRPKLLKEFLAKYESILKNRTVEQEILGLFIERQFTLKISNELMIINRLADKMMHETNFAIPKESRLGVHLGLVEILTNAIEHGNLEIDFDAKKEALEGNLEDWENLLNSRLSDPKFKDRQATIKFVMNQEYCQWTIEDEGKGFDWRNLPDPNDPEILLAANGRGIMLARLQFEEMEYNEKGNQVRIRKYLKPKEE